MHSPSKWAVFFRLPLLFLLILSISIWPTSSGHKLPKRNGHINGPGISMPNARCAQIPHAYGRQCGEHCHTTCANPEPVCDGLKNCVPLCYCKEGYTWDKPYYRGGKCIKPEECHSNDVPRRSADCEDPNIVYKRICHEQKCNPSCKYPNPSEREECRNDQCDNKKLGPPYCVCRAGYVSETEDGMGKCVKLEECPPQAEEKENKKCGPNQHFQEHCDHIRTCQNGTVFVRTPKCLDNFANEHHCYCNPGYVRLFTNGDGPCVKEEECPEEREEEKGKCGPNEEFSARCRYIRDCSNKDTRFVIEPGCQEPERTCYCQWGYVRKYRHGGGPCVREEECPPRNEVQMCGPNEEMAFGCFQRNCSNLNTPHPDRPMDCMDEERCHCKEGYVRLEKDGPCVEEEKCQTCPNANEERLLLCPGYKEKSCYGPEVKANCQRLEPRCVCKQGLGLMREGPNGQGPCVSFCLKRGI